MHSLIMLLLISAPSPDQLSLTVKGRPLLEVIESRLTSLDGLVSKKEGRSALPTDKWFRYRFHSRSLVDAVQPAFPTGLPGTIPLLESPDSRVRCATLLLIKRWLEETRQSERQRLDSSLSQADLRRLRLAILGCIASPKLKDNVLFTGELAVQIFPSLANTALSETEERVLLQKLNTKDPRRQRQIVQLFLTMKPVRFPIALQAPIGQLLRSESKERSRIVLLLQTLDKAPPKLQEVLRAELKRDPQGWPAMHLAMLLSRSGTRTPEIAAGMVRALSQEIPPRGGMMGRGSLSYYAPENPSRWTVLQGRRQARLALMNLPIDQPQVVPQLMTLLDAYDYETRAIGVAAIKRFRSGALIAVPKLLTMNMADTRPQGRIRLAGVRIGLGPEVFYSVNHIIATSLIDFQTGKVLPVLISTGALVVRTPR